MRISELREAVRSATGEFAWGQWAQMGVLAETSRRDRWAADPEALLLFTLEVARDDPRLFDEVLDWLRLNVRLIGVQRLRNLCHDEEDRALVGASLAWAERYQPKFRAGVSRVREEPEAPAPLFRGVSLRVGGPDEAFLAHGLLKPATEPSHKSRPPDLFSPINFAFRLRHLFGVGSRADVIRYLLTVRAPDVNAQLVAEAAAYAKRNVSETLASLVASGVVEAFTRANERRYHVERERWASLLELDPEAFPVYREWPRLLWALRALARWIDSATLDELSDYMLASEARMLLDRIGPSLLTSGVPTPRVQRIGPDYWETFVETVVAALELLGPSRSSAQRPSSPSRAGTDFA
jgi:hypothetical protein